MQTKRPRENWKINANDEEILRSRETRIRKDGRGEGMAPEAEQKGNWEERVGRSIGGNEPKDTGKGEGNASPSQADKRVIGRE